MPELDIEVYYGAFTRSINTPHGEAQLRVFGLGYVDDRTTMLKTDNRPVPVRTADVGKVQLATFGANYAQVISTTHAGKFDFLVWGVYQGGSWGALNQRAGAFVGELGWQPAGEAPQALAQRRLFLWQRRWQSQRLDPRNFLPGPDHAAPIRALSFLQHDEQRGFLRTLNLKPASKLALRTEGHALRLANSADFWYLGGGAFQPKTFGYTGRPSNDFSGLADVWDLSADYQITRSFSTTLYYGHAWARR